MVRVLALEDRKEVQCLVVKDESRPDENILVKYNLPERNEGFNPTIQALRKVFGFPILLNLLFLPVQAEANQSPAAADHRRRLSRHRSRSCGRRDQ